MEVVKTPYEHFAESHCAVKTARMVRRGARLARGKGGRAYSTWRDIRANVLSSEASDS